MTSKFKETWNLLQKCDRQIVQCPDHLQCTICGKLIIDAVQTECGCRFCRKCIEIQINNNKRSCPGTKKYCKNTFITSPSNVQDDFCTNNEVNDLPATCPNDSCFFSSELSNVVNHLKKCPKLSITCPYTRLGCSSIMLTNDKLLEHLQTEAYQHSTKTIDVLKKIDEKTMVMNNEYERIKKSQAAMDLRVKSLEVTIEQQKVNTQQLQLSLRKANSDNETLKGIVQTLAKELENVNFQNKKIVADFVIFEEKNHGQLQKLEENDKKTENEMEKANKQLKDMKAVQHNLANLRNVNDFDKIIPGIREELRFINNKLVNQDFGEFIWKIDKFTEKIEKARMGKNKELMSPLFYSHKNGYKLKLKLCPNGIGNGEGKYMYISFYIIQGDFDNILEWPFKYNIVLSIINQESKDDFVKVVYNFNSTDERDKHIYNKPISDNVGFGTVNFGNINNIMNDSAILKQDHLFIRCIVCT